MRLNGEYDTDCLMVVNRYIYIYINTYKGGGVILDDELMGTYSIYIYIYTYDIGCPHPLLFFVEVKNHPKNPPILVYPIFED